MMFTSYVTRLETLLTATFACSHKTVKLGETSL
jgi:hypothetical protein